jgi:hypothetical protein
MFHDQGDHASDHQQQGQAADTVAMAVVAMVAMVMMPVAVMAAVSVAAVVIAGFVEREFIAHPNIKLTHSVSLFAAEFGR